MPINTTAIASLLRPGQAAIFGDYPSYPSQWTEIFETYSSDKQFEVETEMKYTGLGQIQPEGAPVAMDTMGTRTQTTYYHRAVGLGFVITRQALEDNLYKTKFPQMVKSLKRSMLITKETLAASVLNNGFSTNFPGGDGKPLFSLQHPIDGGVYANMPAVAADLNEASLESAAIAISGFVDVAGLNCMTFPQKLIVPKEGRFVASRLLNSQYRVNTANNDISAIYHEDTVPKGYRVNQYLTSPNAWYILTDAPDGFKHYIRTPIETDTYADFDTGNLKAKAYERYSFGWSNPRCGYASPGT